MNFITRFFGWFGGNATTQRKGSQVTEPSTTAHDDVPMVGVDGALQVSTVWACVTLIVETISSLPLNVFATDAEGKRQELRGSRLWQVLRTTPNIRQTALEFWETMLLNLVLRGNAYAKIDRAPDGSVISLLPLSADQVEVITADDGSLVYVYRYEGDGVVYTERDILHIKGMGNGTVGLSPLDYMRSSVGLAINAQNHTTKTFKKDGRRPGILMTDSVLTTEQREAVKKNFGDIATGEGKQLHVLEAQFKFEPLGMSPADIQLLETRQFAVQDLARWFGVPSVLINDTAQTSSLGSSTAQIVDGFYRLKLRPQLERIEQAIERRVLTPRQRAENISVEFNLDALLRASLKDRMDIYAKAVQNGLKTRNECRRLENNEPLEGGDLLTAQVNLAPVEQLDGLNNGGSVPPDTVRQ